MKKTLIIMAVIASTISAVAFADGTQDIVINANKMINNSITVTYQGGATTFTPILNGGYPDANNPVSYTQTMPGGVDYAPAYNYELNGTTYSYGISGGETQSADLTPGSNVVYSLTIPQGAPITGITINGVKYINAPGGMWNVNPGQYALVGNMQNPNETDVTLNV
ncbi:MAG: hypothetical protein NTX05_05585 [Fusobacteria bacterium]|nr:hypothetical protein [Fusobacteriota bacterium]